MHRLCFHEKGLLIRAEYGAAFDELVPKATMDNICRGVVVTGQPGIGMLSSLMIDTANNGLLNQHRGWQCSHFEHAFWRKVEQSRTVEETIPDEGPH